MQLTKNLRSQQPKLGVLQMKTSKIERTARFFSRMSELGFSYSEAQSLRRIELTLQRWGEAECNGEIQRDEKTQQPFRHYGNGGPGPFLTVKCADREQGALKRLAKIMEKHPELWSYHQSDPRGCQLYIGRKSDIHLLETKPLDQIYTSGFAVCI